MMKRVVCVSLALVAACAENATRTRVDVGGTIVVVTGQDPGVLFPPLAITTQAKQIGEQIYDYLADVGPDLNTRDESSYRAQLASSWRWSSDSLQLSFAINPRARWHDGHAVTARDVAFTFALNKNPQLASRYESSLTNIDSVSVVDSLTAKIWFHSRRPTQFLDAAAQLLILPAHQLEHIRIATLRQATASPPVGSGRFRLRKWNKGQSVEIVADTGNFRGRANVDRVIWTIVPEFNGALARLWRGDADVFDGLRPQDLPDIAQHPAVRAIMVPGMDFAFMRFNLRDPIDTSKPHPLFQDRELRRAITMSIDRRALARNLLDTFAVVPVGPTVRTYPTTDPHLTQLPYDSAQAARLLDSLGWQRKANGVREKNGKELSFTIIVPTISLNRQRAAVILQDQLRRAGVRVNIEQLDQATETSREEQGKFDAALGAWTMGASPDGIWDAWSSKGFTPAGSNFGHYNNPAFDAALDSALKADPDRARDLFSRAYSIINDDAPAVWLYEPRKIIGVHRRIHTNVMRADNWWFSLADWFIPSGDRVLRDRIPPSN
ncbi:MAG TPA: peptide ABC transporter substrate-binding protein [Gemmatimonadaceae bacterium]|nr:peptide ABC transporter substrate-binding protein [Gemmatimonadaceae bacterium]